MLPVHYPSGGIVVSGKFYNFEGYGNIVVCLNNFSDVRT